MAYLCVPSSKPVFSVYSIFFFLSNFYHHFSDPRDRHQRSGELHGSPTVNVHRRGDEGGLRGQIGRAEGTLDVPGPGAGPEDRAGRAVCQVSRGTRTSGRRIFRLGLGYR